MEWHRVRYSLCEVFAVRGAACVRRSLPRSTPPVRDAFYQRCLLYEELPMSVLPEGSAPHKRLYLCEAFAATKVERVILTDLITLGGEEREGQGG